MLAILAAATVAAAPAAPVAPSRAPQPSAQVACKSAGTMMTNYDPALLYRNDGGKLFKPLGALPPANLEKTVLRTIGGCVAPMVVRYGIR